VSGLTPSKFVAAIEELEQRGIVRASPSAIATYDFTHDLIRQAAYFVGSKFNATPLMQ
jgi:hypothetical protein